MLLEKKNKKKVIDLNDIDFLQTYKWLINECLEPKKTLYTLYVRSLCDWKYVHPGETAEKEGEWR